MPRIAASPAARLGACSAGGRAIRPIAKACARFCGPIVAAANIQLATTLPNFLILEAIKQFDGFHETLLKRKIEWQDGHVIPSKEPGLGVELNEEVCEAHPWSGPQLHLSMVPHAVGG